MFLDWLERLSKVWFYYTPLKATIKLLLILQVWYCDRLAAKCTQQRPESDLSKSDAFAG